MSKNQFSEPEELNSDNRSQDYDPMGQPINEKSYTRPNVTIDPKDLAADIPEPSFQPPPIDIGNPSLDSKPKKEPVKPLNPEMNDLPKKDKDLAARHVANMIMQGYEFINVQANKGMMFNEKKLNKLAREGEIDFSIQIPYDYTTNQTISAGEFIQEFNNQQKDTLVVSEQFKEEVTPVLERVLQKRGIGMTDEQYLIFLFGKDIAIKGTQFMAARSQMNEIIKMMREMTEEMKAGNYRPSQTPPPQPSPNYSAPPPPPPSSTTIIDTGEDIEDNTDIDDAYDYQVDDNVVGSVQEQVEAQLQNKTVAQLRREEIAMARAMSKPKPKGLKRGRKKKI